MEVLQNKADNSCDLWGVYRKFKPHLLMTLCQVGYTFLYFITEASFNHGMNPHVYITYRHIVAGLVMLPFAYFLERYSIVIFENRLGCLCHHILCFWFWFARILLFDLLHHLCLGLVQIKYFFRIFCRGL